jgi:hypothetical protein
VFLLRCPRCFGHTPADDEVEEVVCRWCRTRVTEVEWHTERSKAVVREFLLADLRPVADLMRTFAIGQLVIAAVYLFFFLGCGGLITHFHGQVNEVMVIAIGVVLLVSGVFVYAGEVALRLGRWRLIAVTGAIFALTSPLLLGLPIGIWALWKLSRPEGRAVFTSL